MVDEGTEKRQLHMAAPPKTRIQRQKRKVILDAALEIFSTEGFRGATLERIAGQANLSKTNLLYYYPSKEAIFDEVMDGLWLVWMGPLRSIDPNGTPKEEIAAYIRRKLKLSREHPRESRLFTNELLRGTPSLSPRLAHDLRELVLEKAGLIGEWMAQGHLAKCDPMHLLFSVWALTRNYADSDALLRAILGESDPFDGADSHLDLMFTRLLDAPE